LVILGEKNTNSYTSEAKNKNFFIATYLTPKALLKFICSVKVGQIWKFYKNKILVEFVFLNPNY